MSDKILCHVSNHKNPPLTFALGHDRDKIKQINASIFKNITLIYVLINGYKEVALKKTNTSPPKPDGIIIAILLMSFAKKKKSGSFRIV